jgi:hypothetical protein
MAEVGELEWWQKEENRKSLDDLGLPQHPFISERALYDLASIWQFQNEFGAEAFSSLPADPAEKMEIIRSYGPMRIDYAFPNYLEINREDVQALQRGEDPFRGVPERKHVIDTEWFSEDRKAEARERIESTGRGSYKDFAALGFTLNDLEDFNEETETFRLNPNPPPTEEEYRAPRPLSFGSWADETEDEKQLREMRDQTEGSLLMDMAAQSSMPWGITAGLLSGAFRKRRGQQLQAREDNLAELRGDPYYDVAAGLAKKGVREAMRNMEPQALRAVLAAEDPESAMTERFGGGSGSAGEAARIGELLTPSYFQVPNLSEYRKEPGGSFAEYRDLTAMTLGSAITYPFSWAPGVGILSEEEDLLERGDREERRKLIQALAAAEAKQQWLYEVQRKQNRINRTARMRAAGLITDEEMHERNLRDLYGISATTSTESEAPAGVETPSTAPETPASAPTPTPAPTPAVVPATPAAPVARPPVQGTEPTTPTVTPEQRDPFSNDWLPQGVSAPKEEPFRPRYRDRYTGEWIYQESSDE